MDPWELVQRPRTLPLGCDEAPDFGQPMRRRRQTRRGGRHVNAPDLGLLEISRAVVAPTSASLRSSDGISSGHGLVQSSAIYGGSGTRQLVRLPVDLWADAFTVLGRVPTVRALVCEERPLIIGEPTRAPDGPALDLRRHPFLNNALRRQLGQRLCAAVEVLIRYGSLSSWVGWLDYAGISRRPAKWTREQRDSAEVMAEHMTTHAKAGAKIDSTHRAWKDGRGESIAERASHKPASERKLSLPGNDRTVPDDNQVILPNQVDDWVRQRLGRELTAKDFADGTWLAADRGRPRQPLLDALSDEVDIDLRASLDILPTEREAVACLDDIWLTLVPRLMPSLRIYRKLSAGKAAMQQVALAILADAVRNTLRERPPLVRCIACREFVEDEKAVTSLAFPWHRKCYQRSYRAAKTGAIPPGFPWVGRVIERPGPAV